MNSAITEAGDPELKGKRKIHEQKSDMGVKRTRAGDVHNLSERLRRDRINEKIKALQELIPNCNKADKASILDEAIEYLKTLQLQLQMMYKQSWQFSPLMMPPAGMQLPQMPTMSDTGMGRGTGLTYAMGLYDSSNVQHFPVPSMQEQFAPDGFPMYGKLGQGLPVPMPMPVHPPAELPTKASSVTEISMPATMLVTSDVALYSSSKDQQNQSTDIESTEKGSTKRDKDSDIKGLLF